MIYRTFGKRLFDLALTLPALIVFAPLLALLAWMVRVKLGSPVFFTQQRPGLRGEPFILMKFRTMTDGRDASGELLPDLERTTPFGQWLRNSSLDELPELLNVVKGEMSLVGPRPLLMRYLDRYTPAQRRRHDVLPGITGLAQASGRNNLSWDEKFAHDLRYVEQCSLALDVAIIFRTLRAVFLKEGVSAADHFSSPEFMGTAAHTEKEVA